MHSLSTPSAARRAIRDLVDRAVEATKDLAGNELAAQLRVSESYVTKLRKGFRPDRMNQETRRRLEAAAAGTGPGRLALASDVSFVAGILWGIERDAKHIAETAREARARLGYEGAKPEAGSSKAFTPSAGEIAVGLDALDQVAQADPVRAIAPRRRRGG